MAKDSFIECLNTTLDRLPTDEFQFSMESQSCPQQAYMPISNVKLNRNSTGSKATNRLTNRSRGLRRSHTIRKFSPTMPGSSNLEISLQGLQILIKQSPKDSTHLDGEGVEVVHHHVIGRRKQVGVTVHTHVLVQDPLCYGGREGETSKATIRNF